MGNRSCLQGLAASAEQHACNELALWHAGKLGLASVVQFIPLPVIGGYLAFVGYFCLKSGTTLATGVVVGPDMQDWNPTQS